MAPRTTREGGVVVASGGRLIPGNTGGRPAPVGWSAGGSQVKNLFSSRSVVAEPGVVSKACRERELLFSVLHPVNHYGYIQDGEGEREYFITQG